MKSRVMLYVSAVLLLISVAAFALNLNYVGDAASSQTSDPIAKQHSDVNAEWQSTSGSFDGVANTDTGLAISELTYLYGTWKATNLPRDGWLHVVSTIDQEGIELGILPDGSPIPEDYVFENWYRLDGSGMVIEAAVFMYDMSGRVVQSSVFKDGRWTNLTFDIVHDAEPFELNLDNGVLRDVSGGAYADVEQSETMLDAVPVIEVRASDVFASPVSLGGVPGEVKGIRNVLFISAENGEPIAYETLVTLSNDQEISISRTQYDVIEAVDSPPSGILGTLQEVGK